MPCCWLLTFSMWYATTQFARGKWSRDTTMLAFSCGYILGANHQSKLMPCCWLLRFSVWYATTQFARGQQSHDTTMLVFSWLDPFCRARFAGKGRGMFSHTAFWVSAESFSCKVIALCLPKDSLCETRHGILFTRSAWRNHTVCLLKSRYGQVCVFVVIPVVPHKAVAEVSKIGNL